VEAPVTAFHGRVLAALLALRGGEGSRRIVSALSEARVDLNPHQIEAAAFALDSLARGGCLLADEVGLGKTIEAGLVMAQLWTEGKRRQLVLCPATLRVQWRAELEDKLELYPRIVDGRSPARPNPFEADAPVIASIPFAAGHAAEIAAVPWDLVVVDEAHRLRNAYRPAHKTGRALRQALKDRPKLLLTATPLQNDLLELYGLLSLLDERILGPEASFRSRYVADPALAEESAEELKARLAPTVQRTLRRQVKEYVRFTERRSLVEDFTPSPAEEDLYQRVSDYLRRSDALGIDPARRALLVLVYRKLLASSTFAIAPTLRKLADSLEARSPLELEELAGYAEEAEEWGAPAPPVTEAAAREVAELREYAAMAERIPANAKGEALVRALDRIFTVARAHQWPEKAAVFTESRRTQEYLIRLLSERGYAGQISRLSGDAGTAEQRAALIEEFRDKARILVSTEAGAEGLNLQFCNVVVNFDLPWNPQRVEQRIGRCHRYGQPRDVMVINFLNRRNAADARLYQLLEQKLHLFDGVFGASDEILGALENGIDFERRVLDIYQSCRSPAEIDGAFDALQRELEMRIDQRMTEARSLLIDRFDGEVRKRLRLTGERAREAVAERARQVHALEGAPSGAAEPVSYLRLEPTALPARLQHLAGREGWWFVYRFELSGPRPEDRLAHLVLVKDGDRFQSLAAENAEAFLALPAREEPRLRPESVGVADAQERALAEARRAILHQAERMAEAELDLGRERLDAYAEGCLDSPRSKWTDARAAWEVAREALRTAGDADRPAARAAAQRAERAHRRALEAVRAEEDARYRERDRQLELATQQARVSDQRTLIASAYWWF
jgi:superfamily II DNA or RNA helicase